MILLRCALCCILLSSPLVYAAEAAPSITQAEKELTGKVVLLRGMEAGDKISFDANGKEAGSYETGPFAYSAIQIRKVRRSDTEFEVEGRRTALVLMKWSKASLSDLQAVPLKEKVDIRIGSDAAHPEALDAAIGKVFAFNAADVLAGLSPAAKETALYSLAADAPPAVKTETPYKHGMAGLTMPQLVYSVDPEFSNRAKVRHAGTFIVALSMIVDTIGRPEHIRVVHLSADGDFKSNRPSDDYGLPMEAVKAASQYRFDPARLHGTPVPVAINVEVNFRTY